MADRIFNAFYFAAHRCATTRSQVVLSPDLTKRDEIHAAYEAWIANGQDPRVRLRFDEARAILEYDDEAAWVQGGTARAETGRRRLNALKRADPRARP